MKSGSVPLVVSLALFSIGLLISQGLHIFRKHNLSPFFLDGTQDERSELDTSQKWFYGLLYLVPAFGITAFLLFAMTEAGGQRVFGWFQANAGVLFWVAFFGVAGVLCIIKPSQMVRWSLEGRGLSPPYAPWLIQLTRFIGAVFLFIVFAFLGRM